MKKPSTVLSLKLNTALALALALTPPGLDPANIGGLGFTIPARAQPAELTNAQSDALAAYNKAVRAFKAILSQRRAQIDAKQKLPNLPGQAVYLARIKVMSTYKDLTDALPSHIGRPNKFGVPPAYFDADIEPLVEEYAALFRIMQASPANAQSSETRSKTWLTSARRSRAPRASMQQPPKRQAASASGCSSPRRTAVRTSATRGPTNTTAACKRVRLKIDTAGGSGR
jgi:hypothetical protein